MICTVFETCLHGWWLSIGVVGMVDFGEDRPRHVLLVTAILRLVALLFGWPLILLLLLLMYAWLEAGLQRINLDLERAQELIEANLHASCWDVACLWQLKSLVNLLHGSLEHHRERGLHVLDHVVLPQALQPVKVCVFNAEVKLFHLQILDVQFTQELFLPLLELLLLLIGFLHQVLKLRLHRIDLVQPLVSDL